MQSDQNLWSVPFFDLPPSRPACGMSNFLSDQAKGTAAVSLSANGEPIMRSILFPGRWSEVDSILCKLESDLFKLENFIFKNCLLPCPNSITAIFMQPSTWSKRMALCNIFIALPSVSLSNPVDISRQKCKRRCVLQDIRLVNAMLFCGLLTVRGLEMSRGEKYKCPKYV